MTPEEYDRILRSPMAKPPPGVKPHFVDGMDFSKVTWALGMCLLATLAVSVRLYTKIRITRLMFQDDWWLLVSWLFYAGGYVPTAISTHSLPDEVHMWNLRGREYEKYQFYQYLSSGFFSLAIMCLKISLVLQCLRLFCAHGIRNFTFWASHALLWTNTIFYSLGVAFLWGINCKPVQKTWSLALRDTGKCNSRQASFISSAAFNLVSDVLLLLLPQLEIWRLQALRSRRWRLSFFFMLCSFSCICAAVRMYQSVEMTKSKDVTYHMARLGIGSQLEIGFGFLAASLPVFPRFFNFVSTTRTFSYIATYIPPLRKITTNSHSAQPSSGRGKIEKQSSQKNQAIITDLEFQELVLESAHGSVSGNDSVSERDKPSSMA